MYTKIESNTYYTLWENDNNSNWRIFYDKLNNRYMALKYHVIYRAINHKATFEEVEKEIEKYL